MTIEAPSQKSCKSLASVWRCPPDESTTDTISRRGPHDKLGLALSMVYEKAYSVQTGTVDAPNWIHKYIIGRKGANMRVITQDLTQVHVEFIDKEDN